MIITKKIQKKITSYNIKKYSKIFTNLNIDDIIDIPISNIPKSSHEKIDVICDGCGIVKNVFYFSYNKIFTKYGKYLCNKCVISERNKTNLIKYGTKNPINLNEFQKKRKKTIKEKYGSENFVNIEKRYDTNMSKYNTKFPSQNDVVKDKIKNTCLNKYGSCSSLGNKDIRNKSKKTMLSKYGYEYTFQNPKFIEKIKKKEKETKRKNQILQYNEIIDIDYKNMTYTCNCDICNNNYVINTNLFIQRKRIYNTIPCIICNPISKKTSGLEIQLLNFIKDNYDGEIIINTKSIIKPYELDIYLPKLKLAFEFNGLYWHNELNKPNDYHLMKSNMCDELDIQLIHIWEDNWLYKQDILKSMILNKIKKIPNKIYARKTEVRIVDDNKLVHSFLDDNHLQGFIGSSVKIGLFNDNKLVSLMTFGKKRKIMNSKSVIVGEYEMLRFCNKLNTSVIGGASKLFKFFIRNYDVCDITTYADRSYSNGNLYKQLGFKLSHISKPNYYYIVNRERFYRFGFRKDVLVKEGYDPNKSEHEIMLERKIYRIYNSGNYKFIYNKNIHV